MKLYLTALLLIVILFSSCNRIANKTKEGINRGGEVVGETATEFIEGVTEGVDKTLECDIILSKNLIKAGLKSGVYDVKNESIGTNNNELTLYLIFQKDFNKEVLVKVYNKNKLEIGRTRTIITGKKGDAGYFDFTFDKRTDIGFKNKIVIE
jgi:hypothetical protein